MAKKSGTKNSECARGPDSGPDSPDLDSREQVACFVEHFYARLLADSRLAPIFLDVAAIDLDVHLSHIRNYWCKLLLGDNAYQRHTMNIHRMLHDKRGLQAQDFARWLQLFEQTVDESFAGPQAQRAKRVAATIAHNMSTALQVGQ